MLERTFIHTHGIGYATERRLWEAGLDTWSAVLVGASPAGLGEPRYARLVETCVASAERLAAGDFAWFASALPGREHWRALPQFSERIAYLDIETDGGEHDNCVTVIGLSDGETVRQFVRGENLLDFPDAIADTALLVTFFGRGFDLPVLERQFPRLRWPQLHVDLCWGLRRLGYRGGLKSIERQLGWERAVDTAGLSGWDAVRLWREHLHGSGPALELLLHYNAEDIRSLQPLAEFAYRKLEARTLEPRS